MGVQFERLSRMKIVHFGLLWEKIKHDFPSVEEREPLVSIKEARDTTPPEEGWRLSTNIELPRVWYLGKTGNQGQQLLQVQPDKFLLNWRTTKGGGDYPEFVNNRKTFQEFYKVFSSFVDESKIGALSVEQCEITYVNHIPLQSPNLWADVTKTFTSFGATLPNSDMVERISFNTSYWIDDLPGRVHVAIQPAKNRISGNTLLDFRLTARGAPATGSLNDVDRWLDTGHRILWSLFSQFTSNEAKKQWGIISETR